MPIFAATIFVGAFLLFLVQPLIGKYFLPWFGGAPSVWTSCLLFFQAALLGGYLYAHLSIRWLRPLGQVISHAGLIVASLISLPIAPAESWKPADDARPAFQIVILLLRCIGLPYFTLAATSPLLQSWFARSHPGIPPFRLFAFSNLAALLALLSFPFYFEPHFTRAWQSRLWGGGFVSYAVGCVACGFIQWRKRPNTDGLPSTGPPGGAVVPRRGDRWLWLLMPACASVLLLATTNKLCQEVAVMPFLWVAPLALYLLSFIISFDNPRWYARGPFGVAFATSLGAVAWIMDRGASLPISFQAGVYCAALFLACLVCHGEVYRLRPAASQLSGFYLTIATGGALGGIFVAVVAPRIFSAYFELQCGLLLGGGLYLWAIVRDGAAGFPAFRAGCPAFRLSDTAWPSEAHTGGLKPGQQAPTSPAKLRHGVAVASALIPDSSAPVRHAILAAGLLGLLLLGVEFWAQSHRLDNLIVQRTRNFYGVITTLRWNLGETNAEGRALRHGRTIHGVEFIDPPRSLWPTLYYSEKSGVGQALATLPNHARRIGLVGLGIGTLAAYARPQDYLHVYEIDPEVIHRAVTQFRYLSNCPAPLKITPGDGRLSLEREPPQEFNLLVLDAFSDDTIPVHLLTREAFTVYGRHLRTNGLIAVHISNEHLNLEPVLVSLAQNLHYALAIIEHEPRPDQPWIQPSTWAVLSRSPEVLNVPRLRLAARPPQTKSRPSPVWTDDFASLFPILRRNASPADDLNRSKIEVEISQSLARETNAATAIAAYQKALGQNPNCPILLNNLAFLLATTVDSQRRDRPAAVQMARRACELTHYRKAPQVATLAAVLSEAGDFPGAAAMAEKTCWLINESGDNSSLPDNVRLLKLYRANRPFHEWRSE